MEHLYTPWRYGWVTSRRKPKGCLFCRVQKARTDGPVNGILHRGRDAFVILNRYPYNNGHLMVVPNRHVGSLVRLGSDPMREMMELTGVCEKILRRVYRPEGFNLGMNVGRSSGAGIAPHLHMHVVPRWRGDTSFLSVVNGTRILPETIPTTFRKLRREIRREVDPPARSGGRNRGRREARAGRSRG